MSEVCDSGLLSLDGGLLFLPGLHDTLCALGFLYTQKKLTVQKNSSLLSLGRQRHIRCRLRNSVICWQYDYLAEHIGGFVSHFLTNLALLQTLFNLFPKNYLLFAFFCVPLHS